MNAGPHDRDEDFMTHEPPELQRLQGASPDREITLSMGTILGIFFALALVCAICFGSGYTMGRHSAQTTATDDSPSGSGGSFSSFKPSPQSIAMQPVPSTTAPAAPADASIAPATNDASAAAPVSSASASTPAPVTAPAAFKPAIPSPQPAPIVDTAPPPANIVQVAAVSHQEDADVLLSALKRKGYAVSAHTSPADKLIHVQIGPFATHKEADDMRQRLLADGYNAIIK